MSVSRKVHSKRNEARWYRGFKIRPWQIFLPRTFLVSVKLCFTDEIHTRCLSRRSFFVGRATEKTDSIVFADYNNCFEEEET